MKFTKWITFMDEGSSEERVRARYRQLADKELAAIQPEGLSSLGLACYREELARRAVPPKSAQQPDLLKTQK
jgi:hypothetical protein